LAAGAPGEAEISEHIAQFMRRIGLETKVIEIKPGRMNVVGTIRGSGEGPTLLLNGHTDTVGIEGMEIDPLNPVIKEGQLYGRGSDDMKSGLVALLVCAESIIESGLKLKGDVIVAAVCDEEYTSIGTEALMNEIHADAAIITESTDLDIVVAHQGYAWIDVETRGVAAHGSLPEVGIDAIAKMGKVLVRIERLQEQIKGRKHKLVGSPSIHASRIEGGREISTYPDQCRIQVERRTIPGETRGTIEDEMNTLLALIKKEDSEFKGSSSIFLFREPMEITQCEEICQILHKSALEVTGRKPKFIGSGSWMDTAIITKHGVPVVSFGPIGEGAHAAVENVDLDSVFDLTTILERTALNYCGAKP
jgi:acetylornithine deacetylase